MSPEIHTGHGQVNLTLASRRESAVCTLEMKTEVSMIDLMCFSHPLFSIPVRNADIDGFFNSHTRTKRQY
jgi:hypothetical protein